MSLIYDIWSPSAASFFLAENARTLGFFDKGTATAELSNALSRRAQSGDESANNLDATLQIWRSNHAADIPPKSEIQHINLEYVLAWKEGQKDSYGDLIALAQKVHTKDYVAGPPPGHPLRTLKENGQQYPPFKMENRRKKKDNGEPEVMNLEATSGLGNGGCFEISDILGLDALLESIDEEQLVNFLPEKSSLANDEAFSAAADGEAASTLV
ncbi:hypothetical protein RUND412_007103 [Rhizina undulata]